MDGNGCNVRILHCCSVLDGAYLWYNKCGCGIGIHVRDGAWLSCLDRLWC